MCWSSSSPSSSRGPPRPFQWQQTILRIIVFFIATGEKKASSLKVFEALKFYFIKSQAIKILLIFYVMKWEGHNKAFLNSKDKGCLEENHMCSCLICRLNYSLAWQLILKKVTLAHFSVLSKICRIIWNNIVFQLNIYMDFLYILEQQNLKQIRYRSRHENSTILNHTLKWFTLHINLFWEISFSIKMFFMQICLGLLLFKMNE